MLGCAAVGGEGAKSVGVVGVGWGGGLGDINIGCGGWGGGLVDVDVGWGGGREVFVIVLVGWMMLMSVGVMAMTRVSIGCRP